MRQTIKTLFGIFPAILLLLQITSCDNNTKQDFEETGQYIPLAPDYSDKSMGLPRTEEYAIMPTSITRPTVTT